MDVSRYLILALATIFLLAGCDAPSAASKAIVDDHVFQEYTGRPIEKVSTPDPRPRPSPSPGDEPEWIEPSYPPAPVSTPGWRPSASEVPDASQEFSREAQSLTTIDASRLRKIQDRAREMNGFTAAWDFHTENRGLLSGIISEPTVIEGLVKSLGYLKYTSAYSVPASESLLEYYLKFPFLLGASRATEALDSAIATMHVSDHQKTLGELDKFLAIGGTKSFPSLAVISGIVNRYCDLLTNDGDADNLKNRLTSAGISVAVDDEPLKQQDLRRMDVRSVLPPLVLLPEDFQLELSRISLKSYEGCSRYAGWYSLNGSEVKLCKGLDPAFTSEATVHEIAHHFDLALASRSRRDLFYNISWFDHKAGTTHENDEFFRSYGATNQREDFATAIAGYVTDGDGFRSKVRSQLASGKLNLAAKYMFIKYYTPFRGREFPPDTSSPLRILEVSDKAAQYGGNQPRVGASRQALDLIAQIRDQMH